MRYLLLFTFVLVGCAEYEDIHTETEIIETAAPFDLTHKSPERAIRNRHFRGKIVELEIIKSEPIGVSDNWFSGSRVFYEVEYRVVIHHYERVRK